MALLPLHLLGSPVLREQSAPVEAVDDEVRRFIDDLFETMVAADGVGLAANQVGVARRVAVVEVDGERIVLVNPEVLEESGAQTGEEGCLSIPDAYADVTRPARVVVEALDREGVRQRIEAEGLKARAIMHEIDHLDGVLFLDHLSAVKRSLLVAKWKRGRKGKTGHVKEVTPEPAGEL